MSGLHELGIDSVRELWELVDGARARGVRGLTLPGGFEMVLDPVYVAKDKEPDAPAPDGEMPTRATLDETVHRIRNGGIAK